MEVPRDAVKPPVDRCGGSDGTGELTRVSSKRRYGVKQDVHWHNRPETHQRHVAAPNVMYWSGNPAAASAETASPEEQNVRRYREK